MKERTPQDQRWINNKTVQEVHNKILFTGFKDGQFFRQSISARRALRTIAKVEARITKSELERR